ncbi:MAG: DUF4185 domain-containing protein [Planctomycetes bacterium]|nr:DUF4185 domain-containing protein [Planctomycetota bacterium]
MRRFPVLGSEVIAGLDWLGEQTPYPNPAVKGDSFPMTWAADGEIYTSSGDPGWGSSVWGLDVEKFTGMPPDYTISKVNDMVDFTGWGGWGPKPSGMISVNGVLYLAAQNLAGKKPPMYGEKSQNGTDSHIFASRDFGKTWEPNFQLIGHNCMFKGPRFGGPAFINFGRDNENARDEFVYAVSTDQWDNGSQLILGRVHQGRIQDVAAWQWVAEVDDRTGPVWTDDLNKAHAVLSDDRWLSLPEVVYLKSINRYLLLTWRFNEDFSPKDGSRLIIYDAPEPWGPFTLVHYEAAWETKEMNPYCPRLPLKWMEPDGLTGWLQFSGNWEGANKVHYRSHVRNFRLRLR